MFNTVEEIFTQYDEAIDLKKGHPVKGPIQYTLTGERGGEWYLEINGCDVIVHKGIIEKPFSTLELSASDYLDIKNKKVAWGQLINSKKVKFSGNVPNILNLNNYIR